MIRSKLGKRVFALTMICIWAGIITALVWINGLFGIRGIHINKIEPELSIGRNKYSEYCGPSHFYYNNDVYVESTSSGLRSPEDWRMDCIAKAFGNSYDYSTDPAYIYVTTKMGDVYTIRGYNEDFRLMICYTDNNHLPAVRIYDRLNGIWLKYGKELYADRLHLGTFQDCYIRHATDSTWDQEENRTMYGTPFLDMEIVDDFLGTLYQGRFLDDTTELGEEITNMIQERDYYILSFHMENGFIEELKIFPNGYVVFSASLVTLAIQLDKEDIAPLILYYETHIG